MRVFHFHVDRDIVLCSWARHLTLTMPLYTQVYKWVPLNLMLRGNPAMGGGGGEEKSPYLFIVKKYGKRSALRGPSARTGV